MLFESARAKGAADDLCRWTVRIDNSTDINLVKKMVGLNERIDELTSVPSPL